jgi:hypothetical protein
MHPLFCFGLIPMHTIGRLASPRKWTKGATPKVYVGHLHHYSRSVTMIWDPISKLVSPQFHVIFNNKFEMVQPPSPEKN